MKKLTHYLLKTLSISWDLISRYLRRLFKEVAIFLPLLIIALVAFNFFTKPTLFENTKLNAAKNSKDLKAKLILGQLLYESNNLESSKIEMEKILSSKTNDPVTKEIAKEFLNKIEIARNAPFGIRDEITFWNGRNFVYPNSRDINLKLAILNWKLYRLFEANKYLSESKNLDPNNEVVKKIQASLSD